MFAFANKGKDIKVEFTSRIWFHKYNEVNIRPTRSDQVSDNSLFMIGKLSICRKKEISVPKTER